MTIKDILYACEKITSIFFIPIRIFKGSDNVKSFGLDDMPIDPFIPYNYKTHKNENQISYFQTPNLQYYGFINHGSYTLILGPIGHNEYTVQAKRDFAFALSIDEIEFERLYKQMLAIPNYSIPNFLHILLLVNFAINKEKLELSDIAGVNVNSIGRKHSSSPITPELHDTDSDIREQSVTQIQGQLPFERRMLAFVRMGDIAGLKHHFKTKTHGTGGMLANGRLRHLQNFFVMSVTLVSRAAVEGGLYDEEALRLSEKYIRQSESMISTEAIIHLLDTMLEDFTKRVSNLENTRELSPLISSIVVYIKQNISANLDGQTLSGLFHINRKTLGIKFKKELGMTPAEFIYNERIKRAEELLLQTDKSLAEISTYLGFASQSHFQTRFKSAKQQTPMEFRAKGMRNAEPNSP